MRKRSPERISTIPEAERCETVSLASIRQTRCARRAVATVSHPDLRRPWDEKVNR